MPFRRSNDVGMEFAKEQRSANRGNHQQRKTTMENKTTLHPIHPTLQFEAKHAIRFLDNLLKTRTTAVNGGGDLFGAVGVFATGRDIKDDFTTLQGTVGDYDFKWTRDTLECSCDSGRNVIRRGTFEVDFGDAPCDFLDSIWNCPQPEVRACVRAAVSRLSKQLADFAPATDGGVAARFKMLAKRYRLNSLEQGLLLVGLCDAHGILEYSMDSGYRGNRNVLTLLEEAAAYLDSGVDDIMPLVRNSSKLVVCGLIDDDLTPSRDALEYLEGRVSIPAVKSRRIALAGSEVKDLTDWVGDDDEF